MESIEQLKQKAVSLTPVERLELIDAIFESLDHLDPDIQHRWINESESRFQAYKNGELESIEWNDISKSYE